MTQSERSGEAEPKKLDTFAVSVLIGLWIAVLGMFGAEGITRTWGQPWGTVFFLAYVATLFASAAGLSALNTRRRQGG